MTQTPRILAMIGSRLIYGQERANLLVMETLKAQGCEILAVVEDHPSFRIMPQELEKRGIPYVEAPAIGRRADGYLLDFIVGNPVRYLRLRKQLRAVVREFQPTHIHVPNPFAFLMADAVAQPELPIIYRIGDEPPMHNAVKRWIWRRIARRVTHFVADSEFIAQRLISLGIERERMCVIFTPPAKRSKPPQPHHAPSNPQHVLFLGQLTPNKGIDLLLEAFQQVATDFPQARLTVVGRISDWSGDDWQRRLRDKTLLDSEIGERVSFVGEQENIYRYLASAAFLVVPSVWEEPFGLVVGEAKAAARPSVVFPRGGLPEQIMHGEDGFICRDTSIEALVEGLRYYLSEPERAREHGRKALASMTRLGIDQFAQRWRALFDATTSSTGLSSRNSRETEEVQ